MSVIIRQKHINHAPIGNPLESVAVTPAEQIKPPGGIVVNTPTPEQQSVQASAAPIFALAASASTAAAASATPPLASAPSLELEGQPNPNLIAPIQNAAQEVEGANNLTALSTAVSKSTSNVLAPPQINVSNSTDIAINAHLNGWSLPGQSIPAASAPPLDSKIEGEKKAIKDKLLADIAKLIADAAPSMADKNTVMSAADRFITDISAPKVDSSKAHSIVASAQKEESSKTQAIAISQKDLEKLRATKPVTITFRRAAYISGAVIPKETFIVPQQLHKQIEEFRFQLLYDRQHNEWLRNNPKFYESVDRLLYREALKYAYLNEKNEYSFYPHFYLVCANLLGTDSHILKAVIPKDKLDEFISLEKLAYDEKCFNCWNTHYGFHIGYDLSQFMKLYFIQAKIKEMYFHKDKSDVECILNQIIHYFKLNHYTFNATCINYLKEYFNHKNSEFAKIIDELFQYVENECNKVYSTELPMHQDSPFVTGCQADIEFCSMLRAEQRAGFGRGFSTGLYEDPDRNPVYSIINWLFHQAQMLERKYPKSSERKPIPTMPATATASQQSAATYHPSVGVVAITQHSATSAATYQPNAASATTTQQSAGANQKPNCCVIL